MQSRRELSELFGSLKKKYKNTPKNKKYNNLEFCTLQNYTSKVKKK